jgi:hypothetical protein
MLPDSPQRSALLVAGTSVWALWCDGRWYPGTIDRLEGPLRHVTWTDGDSMWIEARHAVLRAVDAAPPALGDSVLAQRWDGRREHGVVEEQGGARLRVCFADGEEEWVQAEDVQSAPRNPFV